MNSLYLRRGYCDGDKNTESPSRRAGGNQHLAPVSYLLSSQQHYESEINWANAGPIFYWGDFYGINNHTNYDLTIVQVQPFAEMTTLLGNVTV